MSHETPGRLYIEYRDSDDHIIREMGNAISGKTVFMLQ